MERPTGPPSPSAWLAETLETSGRSRSELARMIGRSREEVTRWSTGREQIPRIHLVEIASQLSPADLDYVLKLKDCEDAYDRVVRQAALLSRASRVDADDVVAHLVRAMDGAMQSVHVDRSTEALEWVRNLSAAIFALRTWTDFIQSHGTRPLIDSGNIGRHLQYPVNLLVGTLLTGGGATAAEVTRTAGLVELRRLVDGTKETAAVPVIRQHALHLLARYGDAGDRDIVNGLLGENARSTDLLTRKLGYCGLMMSPDVGQESADEFVYYLSQDDRLAKIDLAFDATHYGDLSLSRANEIQEPAGSFVGLATNIAKHYENPDRYRTLSDADAFRLLTIIDTAGIKSVGPDVPRMLRCCLASDLIPGNSGSFSRLLRRRLAEVLGDERPTAPVRARNPARTAELDAFLAYQSGDLEVVTRIAEELKRQGIRCWLDVWAMVPGELVQEAIESALDRCGVAVVFLGSGLGRWQRLEARHAVTTFVERGRPVIPVIIDGVELPDSTPLFLREFHAVRAADYSSPEAVARQISIGISRAVDRRAPVPR